MEKMYGNSAKTIGEDLPGRIADTTNLRLFAGDLSPGADGPKIIVTPEMLQVENVRRAFFTLDREPGEVWDDEAITRAIHRLGEAEITPTVVESLPLHRLVLYARPSEHEERDKYIRNFAQSLRNLGANGIHKVMINFMGFDWARTNANVPSQLDGETVYMSEFRHADREKALQAARAHMESSGGVMHGWSTGITMDDLNGETGPDVSRAQVRENICAFFQVIIPVAQEAGVTVSIHPDDPPFRNNENEEDRALFGFPRLASTEADYDQLFAVAADIERGRKEVIQAVYCTGALAPANDDLVAFLRKLAREGRLGPLHLRDVEPLAPDDITYSQGIREVPTGRGSVPFREIARVLVELDMWDDIDWRPDHGYRRDGEVCRDGYSFPGRIENALVIESMIRDSLSVVRRRVRSTVEDFATA